MSGKGAACVEPKKGGVKRKLSKNGSKLPTRRKVFDLRSSVRKTLASVAKDHTIGKVALSTLTSLASDLTKSIGNAAVVLLQQTKAKTLTAHTARSATMQTLSGDLAKHAVSSGAKAVANFLSKKGGSATKRAQLHFSVPRVALLLRSGDAGRPARLAATGAVFVAGVVQYVVEEILDVAASMTRDMKRKLIGPRALALAIAEDKEIAAVRAFANLAIRNGGVTPHIEAALLPKKSAKAESAAAAAPKKAAPKKATAAAPKKSAPKKGKKRAAKKAKTTEVCE